MGHEWSSPGIILTAVPFGEGDLVAAIFTEPHGVYRGLVRGGASRSRASTWQPGNLVEARWAARLADQLGSLTAELLHPSAALAMSNPESLMVLAAACAVTEGALPEREPFPEIFRGLLHLIVRCSGLSAVAELVIYEHGLLAQLGYGLDLSECALTGSRDNLAYVSPKSGRAVSEAAAGQWREKLLPLPPFLAGNSQGNMPQPGRQALADGLRLTRHFLARDVFGTRHRPIPPPRDLLFERVCRALPA